MLQRGRPSSKALSVAASIEIMERPRAPHDLNDEETEVWSVVVDAHPADWFSPSNVPLLTQYCRHVVQGRRVAELIERATSGAEIDVRSYDLLLKMQQRESLVMTTLATKMRITNQSVTNQRGNRKSPSTIKTPWDWKAAEPR